MDLPPTTISDHSEQYPSPEAAAILIQRLWRKKNKKFLNPNIRWDDATTHAQFMVDRTAAYDGKNSPRERWRRAAFLVGRLQDNDKILRMSHRHEANVEQKHLETQHWLELVDTKHRYGSNLKWYHRRWQEENTTENFFKWLDAGEGKKLSLKECPRTQLDKETIRYLSAEQRLNYLVKISDDGKLLWAKNDQPVDTSTGRWMDAGDGTGIIPQSTPKHLPKIFSRTIPARTSSNRYSNDAIHSADQRIHDKYNWARRLQQRITPTGTIQRLSRKTARRDTWIYVSDKNFNIFIGIKETGKFQHSSFVAGGLVTSAGLITVKDGTIHTLSPLSGHYRTSINHFRGFLHVLTERGVDMKKVKISEAEATLWGVEQIAKWKARLCRQ